MLHWYVVHSKLRKEAWVFNQLTSLQIDAFFPCYREHIKLHYGKARPYFPGYLFIQIDMESPEASVLKWLPGSLGLVTFGGAPARVPDSIIQKIRHHVDQINAESSKQLAGIQPGEEVTIQGGPFDGSEAIFDVQLPGSERVRVLLKLLQDRQMSVELPAAQVQRRRRSPRIRGLRRFRG